MSAGLFRAMEGSWRGEGIGEYPPSVAPFKFSIDFTLRGIAPSTWEVRIERRSFDTGQLSSLELGSIKSKSCDNSSGKLEFAVVHSMSGLTELSSGNYSDDTFEVTCRNENFCQSNLGFEPSTLEYRRVVQLKQPEEGKPYLEILVEKATSENAMQSYLVSRLYKIR